MEMAVASGYVCKEGERPSHGAIVVNQGSPETT